MEETPPVSALCVTYGRPHLLEEAIYSFLQQDYAGEKEMIILNDLAEQQLSFDHPEIRIVNIAQRFHSLGEKRNACVALASHDILFPWDDDDIYLPHRISFSVRNLSPERGFFKPNLSFECNNAVISGPVSNVFQSSSCVTRDLFYRAKGFPSIVKGEDVAFDRAVEAIVGKGKEYKIKHPSEAFYLYRWYGTGSYHISGVANKPATPEIENERAGFFVRQQIEKGLMPTGVVPLEPKWRNDYTDMVADYVRQYDRESKLGEFSYA